MDISPASSRSTDLLVVFGLFGLVTAVTATLAGRWREISAITKRDLAHPFNLAMFIAMLTLIVWGLGQRRSPAMRRATFAGLLALTIAWYAHVDLIFASFALTFLLTLYFTRARR